MIPTAPLQEIERAVQERAREVALDVAARDGSVACPAPGADRRGGPALDHRLQAGRAAFDLPDPDTVAERAYRNLAGYGPLDPLLADETAWEIMINAPEGVFVES